MERKEYLACIALVAILIMSPWPFTLAKAQMETIPRGGTLKVAYIEPAQLNPVRGAVFQWQFLHPNFRQPSPSTTEI